MTGIGSDQTVARAIKECVDKGYMLRVPGEGQEISYGLNMDYEIEVDTSLRQPFKGMGHQTTFSSLPAPPDKTGYVYVLQADNGLCKIGKAKVLDKRVEQLEVQLPYDLELLVSIETDDRDSLEKELHEKFADKRKKGEWFDLTKEDIAYIKGLGNPSSPQARRGAHRGDPR